MARLRRAVGEIEARSGPAETRAPGAGLSLTRTLDRALGGGLAGDALHEIVPATPGDGAAAMGFALALAARFMAEHSAAGLLMAEDFAARDTGALYGPGLVAHGLELGRLVFVRAPDAPALFQAMEEALKSGAPAVVVGEVWRLAEIRSRRLAPSVARRALGARAGPARAGERLSRGRPDFQRGRNPLRDRGRAERASALGGRPRPAGAARLRRTARQGAPDLGAGTSDRPRCGAGHPPDLEKRGQAV